MARNKIATSDKSLAYDGVVTLEFANGKELKMSVSEVPERIITRLASHGLEQKTRDAGAGCGPDEAYLEAAEVWANLLKGNWGAERAAGVPKVGKLVLALTRIIAASGGTFDRAAFDALTKEEVAKIRGSGMIKAEFAKMDAEAAVAAPSVDLAGLFAVKA